MSTPLDGAARPVRTGFGRAETGATAIEYALIATLNGPGHTSYADASVAADVGYTYRVRAQNIAGYSLYSNESSVNTTIAAAPTGLSATTVSGTRIDLAWTDNANGETGYYIERCLGLGCSSWTPIAIAPAEAQAYSDESVVAGEIYNYQVRAQTAFGLSFASNTASATTLLPADR